MLTSEAVVAENTGKEACSGNAVRQRPRFLSPHWRRRHGKNAGAGHLGTEHGKLPLVSGPGELTSVKAQRNGLCTLDRGTRPFMGIERWGG